MSNNSVKSKNIPGVLFAAIFTVLGFTSCGNIVDFAAAGAATPALTVSVVPSRTSGVAPLAVFFDASGTTGAGRPFHDIEYRWNFGEDPAVLATLPGGANWTNGSTKGSRNLATGPVAGHVFETPGTYTVTLSAFDGTNTATATTTITVTAISGANTFCVSSNSVPVAGVGGCPAGATGAQQPDWPTLVNTYVTAGKAVLLKRGDTFNASVSPNGIRNTGGLIGAYGTGVLPVITSSVASIGLIGFATLGSDWRVMDLNFVQTTPNNTSVAIGSDNTAPRQITVLRVTTTGFSHAVSLVLLTIPPDQIAIVDSNFSVGSTILASSYGLFCGDCTKVMVLGNHVNIGSAGTTNHNIRLEGVVSFSYSNNTILAAAGVGSNDGFSIRGTTRFGVISDNNFPAGGGGINPSSNTSSTAPQDIIVERNWFATPSATATMMGVSAVNVTIRNNIFNLTNLTNWKAISVFYTNTAGSLMPTGINIYNNTVFNSNAEVGSFRLVSFGPGLTGACTANVKNNLGHSPNSTSVTWIRNIGGCIVSGSAGTMGNSLDSQINISPRFANLTPSDPADFMIGAGSYALNTGVAAPVFSDFFRTVRPRGSAIDVGAFEQ